MILSGAVKNISSFILIRYYQDLIKVYHELLVFQILGKMFQVLQETSRSCMFFQDISSFFSLVT